MSSRRLEGIIENPTLELKIISANEISYIDASEKLDVYAIVSIKGENAQQKQAAKTPIDYDGGSNPTWNHTVKFPVNEREVNEGLLIIYIKLFSYWLEGEDDLYLGAVSVSVQELLASNPFSPIANGNIDKMKTLTYPVKLGETIPNAKLSLSYRFKPIPVKDLYPPVYPNPEPIRSGQPVIYSPQLQRTVVTKITLELVIKFAKDIKKVNIFNEMDVYALVIIREGKKRIKMTKTPIVYTPYKCTRWDHPVKFSLDGWLAQDQRLMLSIELMSHRPLLGDKQIGEVNVLIKELLGMNPPSPITTGDGHEMMLVTQDVLSSYGKKGTLTFTYRFLTEQVTVSKSQPSINPQPIIMYLPVSQQTYASPDSTHGTSGYVSAHPGAHVGPSHGGVPVFMSSPYQSNGYQHYSHQPSQSEPQQSQLQPQPQPLLDTHSQPHQSYGYQHYSSPEPLSPQQSTQSQAQTQKGNGTIAAIGLGAAVLGRTIGGALLSEFITNDI